MRRWVRAGVACALLAGASAARAAPHGKAAAPAPPRAGALVSIATEIARGLGEVPAGALVVASPLETDEPAPKAAALSVRIAAQIAGRIGARAHAEPETLGAARGLSGRAASLVYVQVAIDKGALRATADLYPVVSNGWERLRNPVPGPRAHAFATAPLDAEVRTFMKPVLLEKASVHKAKHGEGEVLAVGCGDLEGDGGMELVLVSRARVAVGRLRGGRFVAAKTEPWSHLASRVPVPMREPVGSVLVSPPGHEGEILVGTTDRGGVALDRDLAPRRQLTGLPVAGALGDACAVAVPDASAFDGYAVACEAPAAGEPAVRLQAPAPRFDAIAAGAVVRKDGAVSAVVAAREPGGPLRVRRADADGKPVETWLDDAGAQVAIGDLDLDGAPEIVTTNDSSPSSGDVVLVSSFAKDRLEPRLRFTTREGVRALGVCPPEAHGVPALVAVIGDEVWVVR